VQERRLESLRTLRRFLDEQFRVPGTRLRFGWDPLIGLIPWVGDAVTAILGAGIILQAHSMRVPRVVQLRMLVNVAIDLLVGVVPVVGDAIDFVWKSNSKNFALLERHVSHVQWRQRAAAGAAVSETSATAGDYLFVGGALAVIAAVAMVPLFVMYWLLHAVGPHLPAFTR
jgi:Domain of unknown function (DUF4112)